jgi:hypothetical protein
LGKADITPDTASEDTWYRAISNADVTWCCHTLYLTPPFVNRIMLSVRRNFTNANYFQFYNWHTRFFALLQIN